MIWVWRNEYFSNFWVWVLEKWVWMFEKEERTRKLEKVQSRLKKEKKRFGERRKQIQMGFMFTSVLPHLELVY